MSLLVSGVLTWFLVRNLEEQTTKDNLQRQATLIGAQIAIAAAGHSNLEVAEVLDAQSPQMQLGDDRLIVLQRQSDKVLFDSQRQLLYGQALPVTAAEPTGVVTITGGDYVFGAARPRGYGVILLRPQNDVAAAAGHRLVPNLLVAGGISLAVAFLLALLVTRAMTQPLTELAAASEDIARGNYGRRVRFAGGGEIGIVGLAFNRMAEAVERARQAQREFLANVSHELKTPLTSLIGFSQALVEGGMTPGEQQRAATIVHEESERMLRMSQELLDLARVEAGQVPISLEPVDLVALLGQERDLMRKRAEARRLRLALEVSPSVPPALADPERLHQVLDNLLDNAVKYAPAGSQVSVRVLPTTGGRIEVQVSNPVGAHRPDPQRIFERFYRADPSRSTAAGGVGLGLAISQELAGRIGGRLGADFDAEGRLRMRLQLSAAGPADAQEAAEAPGPGGLVRRVGGVGALRPRTGTSGRSLPRSGEMPPGPAPR